MAKASAEVQDVGWLAWRDPRAWMESMRGPRWAAVVKRENEAFDAAVRSIAGKEEAEAAVSKFEAAAEEGDVARGWRVHVPCGEGGCHIRVLPHGSAGITWLWEEEGAAPPHPISAGDLAVGQEGLLAYTLDFGKGAESYELVVQRGRTILWRSRGVGGRGYGPFVAILGDHAVVLEASGPLQYSRLVAIELENHGKRVLIHEEPADSSWMLSLIKGERGCLFLLAEQAGRQRLFELERGLHLRRLSPEGVCFHPIGYTEGNRQDPCYFVRRGSIAAPWQLEGPLGRHWQQHIPLELRRCGIERVVASLGLIVWKQRGERIFWLANGRRHHPRLLCEFIVNPWALWAGKSMHKECVVTVPGASSVRATLQKGGIHLDSPLSEYGGRRRMGMARSADGTGVRWACIENANRAKGAPPVGLLVAAYGAYGIPTTLDTSRWKPYLERGWAVGLAFVRGGGDDNEVWAELGRREGKLQGVEDLEACVREIQAACKVGADKTVLFGRSAGGYLVGAAVARHPRGDVFGTAYVEVPYVDVLRTASNPALPLTAYEYNEFGDPAHRVADFEFLLRHSPITGLEPEGAPGVTVICRTSLNDRQVYAYESAKWVDALRGVKGEGAPKWLAFQAGVGHFTLGMQQSIQRAEDYILLTY
jgi:hypothetical protein